MKFIETNLFDTMNSNKTSFQIGQRWVSDMEPELGLGIVTAFDERTVHLYYPAGECSRQYALRSAPIKRVAFRAGDSIQIQNGESFVVREVIHRDNLFIYSGKKGEIPESKISDTLSFSTPQNRLLGGLFDKNQYFELRIQTLKHYSDIHKSPVRGFTGGRVALIPHQIYIAYEVTRRAIPRVLLSDEVGLGKTIEACMILHHLLLTGRINRVLILVPESLVHQWFVELLRKFNFFFRLGDESYLDSVEKSSPQSNPFLSDNLFLVNIDYLSTQNNRKQQAVHGEWDMVVVDEAHHLQENSDAYLLVKELGLNTWGTILLTATPEQLGHRHHFARLALLDPARYHKFESFEAERFQHQQIARLAEKLTGNSSVTIKEAKLFNKLLPDQSFRENQFKKEKILQRLLDQYGMGRVMFRNTRANMTGFPKRKVSLISLKGEDAYRNQMVEEFKSDINAIDNLILYDFSKDPRIQWIVQWLKINKNEKGLLICRTKEKALAIDVALKKKINVSTALFHENLTLIQRDRNAAWFAQTNGARLLICSEIGSEGRNFQFVHHLILFDLPLDPELLEQRIGRLDRIGQTETISIHVPFIENTPQERLASWIHHGLNALATNISGAYDIYKELGPELNKQLFSSKKIDAFIEKTKNKTKVIALHLEKGRDRLLELHSFNKLTAEQMIKDIQCEDKDLTLDAYMIKALSAFGIRFEEMENRSFQIDFELLENPDFPIPVFRDEHLLVTLDRDTAIQREDIEFLTWDHPMITGAMELILASERGNSTIVVWRDKDCEETLLEAIFILECVAPPHLHVNRFLPPTPIRIVIDSNLKDVSDIWFPKKLSAVFREVSNHFSIGEASEANQLPDLIAASHLAAEEKMAPIILAAKRELENHFQTEINRLKALQKINPNVREEEILFFEESLKRLDKAVQSARVRLDSLRLILPNLLATN